MNNFTIIAFNRLFLTSTLNILFYLIVFDEFEKLARVKLFIFLFFCKNMPASSSERGSSVRQAGGEMIFRKGERFRDFSQSYRSCNSL